MYGVSVNGGMGVKNYDILMLLADSLSNYQEKINIEIESVKVTALTLLDAKIDMDFDQFFINTSSEIHIGNSEIVSLMEATLNIKVGMKYHYKKVNIQPFVDYSYGFYYLDSNKGRAYDGKGPPYFFGAPTTWGHIGYGIMINIKI